MKQKFSANENAPAPARRVALLAPTPRPGAAAVWETLAPAEAMLAHFGLEAERAETPSLEAAEAFARDATRRGLRLLIVAAEDARLPAALAGAGPLPVLRVPVPAAGGDALATLWPEPAEPAGFATVAVGEAGAKNAALLAVAILALGDERLREALQAFRNEQTATVLAAELPGWD